MRSWLFKGIAWKFIEKYPKGHIYYEASENNQYKVIFQFNEYDERKTCIVNDYIEAIPQLKLDMEIISLKQYNDYIDKIKRLENEIKEIKNKIDNSIVNT